MKWIKTIARWMGMDGALHFALSALLVCMLGWVKPMWVAAIIVLFIGIGKEIYDRVSNTGTAEWHDIICDVAGILFGMFLVIINHL